MCSIYKGTYTAKTGNKYVGEWQNDKKCGVGVMHYPDGAKYDGEFRDGKINGKGSYFYKNGDRFVGEWAREKKHGKGVCSDLAVSSSSDCIAGLYSCKRFTFSRLARNTKRST